MTLVRKDDGGRTIKLYTKYQALDYLHEFGMLDLNIKWFDRNMDRGNIPYVVIARKRRIRTDFLDRMVSQWLREAM